MFRKSLRDNVTGGVAAPVPLGRSPLHHLAYVLPHIPADFGLDCPNGFQDGHYILGSDPADGPCLQSREGVCFEGRPEACSRPRALPVVAVNVNHSVNCCGESRRYGRLNHPAQSPRRFPGVNPRLDGLGVLPGLFSRLGQGQQRRGAKP